MSSGDNSAQVTTDMDARGFSHAGCIPDLSGGDRMIWDVPHQLDGISMRLNNRKLWQTFNALGTEMIITKPGRRMFPFVDLKLEGLVPEDSYSVVLELRQCSEYRYRFQHNRWIEGGRANPPQRGIDNMYVLSPKKGKEWMQDACCMYFVKITNSNERVKPKGEEERPLVLSSMQKYIPVVHVIRTDNKFNLTNCPKASFILQESEFFAVTAYQNVAVKDLKVANNPFAKAFRPGARKRKRNQTLEAERLMSDGGSGSSPSSASPSSLSTSSSAVAVKVVDEPNDQTPTNPLSYSVFPALHNSTPYPALCSSTPYPALCSSTPYPALCSSTPHPALCSSTPHPALCSSTPHPALCSSTPYPEYREQATRMMEMMQQYLLVRPWEVPPITICNSNPYGFNISYPMPLYWNSVGYPLPQPPFYPALPPPPTYPFENELIDLSMRADDKDKVEENPT